MEKNGKIIEINQHVRDALNQFRRISNPPAWSIRICNPANKARLPIAGIEQGCSAGLFGFKILILGSGG